MPPVFHGSLTTVISEDVSVGTHILTINAKDGDRGEPRNIIYDLIQSTYKLNYNIICIHVL